MVQPFSSIQRNVYLEKLSEKKLDLLIIGGGITGAGIALDASSRGLSTGLVEMQDFAAGTSSRSTKLVHGGLRYLKQFEIKLVAEVGRERAIVYENAPHVTTPEWMLLPITKGGTFGKYSTSVGLKIYDYLAGVKRSERRTMLSHKETLVREPLLKKEGLKGSGVYVEYKTDDARLTIEVIKEAARRGATAANYSKVTNFIYENNKAIGVVVKDMLSDNEYEIFAEKIVSAAGPWVDSLRERDNSKKGKFLHLTKGVHIVVDQARFPLSHAVYFDAKDDGRMLFAIPREGKTYIGTTDTTYKADLVNPRMDKADLEYILKMTNNMFPNVKLAESDVESSWAGLRPLIQEEGKKESEISRKDEVFISDSGLISIAGGKLTGYRKMAKKIVDLVCNDLHVKQKCVTADIKLSGGDIGGSEKLNAFIEKQTERGMEIGLDRAESEKLARLYGSNVQRIHEIIETAGEEASYYQLPKGLFASLVYGIEEEMVVTPLDFFERRTSALFFNIDWVKEWMEPVLEYMANRLKWSEDERKLNEKILKSEIEFSQLPEEAVNTNFTAQQ